MTITKQQIEEAFERIAPYLDPPSAKELDQWTRLLNRPLEPVVAPGRPPAKAAAIKLRQELPKIIEALKRAGEKDDTEWLRDGAAFIDRLIDFLEPATRSHTGWHARALEFASSLRLRRVFANEQQRELLSSLSRSGPVVSLTAWAMIALGHLNPEFDHRSLVARVLRKSFLPASERDPIRRALRRRLEMARDT